MSGELELEIFRAGDYGVKGVWGEAELDRIAADYDPALHEAPVTVDHARRGPALGWVAALRRVGDRLVARLRGLNARFLELVRAGAFKKRSAEIYPCLAESGGPYLRAVSFLGAAVPEVKGLADPVVPENDEGQKTDAADAAPADRLFTDDEGEFVTFEPSTTARDDEETAAAPALAVEPSAVSFAEVCERLRGAGKWRPAWSERGIEAFFAALPARGAVPVGDGRTLAPAEWFAEFLESLPATVALGEAASVGARTGGEGWAGRAVNVDPASVALHRAAVAFMETHPGAGYAEALSRCASDY
ncbi:MAG: hypothetical protein M1457_11540 [bacterium]|nr:hypothetical protein [bacterium]